MATDGTIRGADGLPESFDYGDFARTPEGTNEGDILEVTTAIVRRNEQSGSWAHRTISADPEVIAEKVRMVLQREKVDATAENIGRIIVRLSRNRGRIDDTLRNDGDQRRHPNNPR